MAYDGYLKIEGIPGESTDQVHAGWIEIISFKHEVSQPAGSATSRIGGRTGARVDIRDFCVTKVVDKSSPNLHLYCCNGKHITQIIVELCEASESKLCFMRYTMTDVIVSSIKPSGVANEQIFVRPIEEVTFNFGQIRWEYTPKDHMGKPQAVLQSGWTLEENRAI